MSVRLDEARIRLLNINGGIQPIVDNTYNLGTSSLKWANVYATKFVGALNGNADTATKLTSSAGSSSQPIYFSDGKPVAITGNIANNSASADRILYKSNHTEAASGTTGSSPAEGLLYTGGLFLTGTYNDSNTPVSYGNIINIAGSGTGQLLCQWQGSDNVAGHLYYRSHRDTSTGGWSPWITILDSSNYNSYSPTLTGTGASGTWGISISGNSATATKLGTSTIGSSTVPIYLNAGTATTCSGRTVPGIKSASSVTTLGWGTNNTYVADISLLAYWNGAYSGTSSNLSYCSKGAFGSIVTKNTGDYIPISGGTLSSNTAQIQRAGSSTSWINGRGNAMIRINSYSGYNAIYSMKTTNGDWSCGVYSNDILYWSYCTDTNFNAGTNATTTQMRITSAGALYATNVYGAVWNDYAEFRESNEQIEPGRVAIENGDDTLSISTGRLQPGPNVVSDTYGFAIGETSRAQTSIAVSGRVLAYPYEPRDSFSAGDPVCSGPNGTVSKMTREEVIMYPDRMIGTVSAIPDYEVWGTGNVPVNGRIWIKVI